MNLKFCVRNTIILLIVFTVSAASGCDMVTKIFKQKPDGGFPVKEGKMLHVKQVVEHYDALGQPVPQYYELWIADKKGLGIELDRSGKEIRRMIDTDGKHITYDPKTRGGVKYDFSQIFMVDFKTLKSSYPQSVQADDQKYAGRSCAIYLLENDSSGEWIKAYVDKDTGYILLCDAPLFRLRTAILEEVPVDNKLFTIPSDIIYK